jgi:hypothetical protein
MAVSNMRNPHFIGFTPPICRKPPARICKSVCRASATPLRRDPLAVRRATLERILAREASGIRFNEHLDEEDGPHVFHHACKLGFRGNCVEAAQLALPLRPFARLDQVKEPGRTCRET